MQLTDAQKQSVTQWVKEGCGLSEIQKRLTSEFQLSIPYIDVRFLIIDLGLDLKEQKAPVVAKDLKAASLAPPEEGDADMVDANAEPSLGGVQVEIDRVVRAGALVSGTVVFSDGTKAVWALDQMGRLALDAGGKKGYRPSQADVQAFQDAVSRQLQKRGF